LIPSNIIRVNTAGLRSDDYISITLMLDPRFRAQSPSLTDRIFIMGVPALYGLSEGSYWKLPSLRISQEMLPGRTKGFRFRLSYRYARFCRTPCVSRFFHMHQSSPPSFHTHCFNFPIFYS
jgi:hypothetical protein